MDQRVHYEHAKEPPYAIMSDIPTVTIKGITKQFLVDRNIVDGIWWTFSEEDQVFQLKNMIFSFKVIHKFKHNNPQIVSLRYAQNILREQREILQNLK